MINELMIKIPISVLSHNTILSENLNIVKILCEYKQVQNEV